MNINIILYDDFETLDALGIANIFGKAPEHFYINYLSVNGGIVSSRQGVKVWTEILIPDEVEDILVLPGGRTANRLLCLEPNKLKIIKAAAQEADICMMIANGSSVLAQTGLLYHRQIADYPGEENWKRMFTAEIRRDKMQSGSQMGNITPAVPQWPDLIWRWGLSAIWWILNWLFILQMSLDMNGIRK